MQVSACSRVNVQRVRAAVNTSAPGQTLRALNITKRTLIDSNGGRAVRNVDSEIYEIVYVPASDTVQVLCRTAGKQYTTEIGKDQRISIVLASAQPLAGGAPSFAQLQALMKGDGPGPEAINSRVAMLAFYGAATVELFSGQTLVQQAANPVGAAAALGLMVAVTAASLAPFLLGKVAQQAAFPSVNDSYPDRQLPSTWTAVAEQVNGRAAMIGILGLIVTEAIRGQALFF